MSDTSIEARILDTLARAGGSQSRARLMLLDEAARDPELLYALTRPHLNGIVAYAVDRAIRKKGSEPAVPPPAPDIKAIPGEAFGKELLKALALGDPARFGEESFSAPSRRASASQRHIDALRRMASPTPPSKKS